MEDNDIKILEEFLTENRDWKCIECGFNCKGEIQALENLLKRYKELEEGCKTCVIRNDLNEYVENSIPISVIQNKIDELKEKGKHIPNKGSLDYQIRQYNYIGCKIDILQELLEEGGSKC